MKKIYTVIILSLVIIFVSVFSQAADTPIMAGGITPQVFQKANMFVLSLFPQLEPIGNGKWYFYKYGFVREYRIKNVPFKNPPSVQLKIFFELNWDGSFLLWDNNSGLATGNWTDWMK